MSTTLPFEVFSSSIKDKLVRATDRFSGPEETEINNSASQDFHFYVLFSDFFPDIWREVWVPANLAALLFLKF